MITRCVRCLMPATYPEITFDDDGVCHHCLTFEQPEPIGEDRLLQKIRAGRGAQYDCVLGISGGKDSCYVAYLAAKKLGLRVLAVSYDFPFMVDLARENTRSVCEQLGIELLVVRSRNNLEVDLLRNHLISLAPTGTTWGQCMFCHYGIAAILYQTAQSRQIPFILSGVTHSETWWNPGSRTRILARRLGGLPLADKAIFGLYQARAFAGLVDQRRQFPMPGNSFLNVYQHARAPEGGPQTLRVFDYVGWDQERIEQTLQEETGWRKPCTSLTWRYDCILEPLLDLTFKRDLGISSAGLYLCGLIRAGQIGRQEALRLMQEKEDPSQLEASLKSVLDFLAIPPAVGEKYLGALRGESI